MDGEAGAACATGVGELVIRTAGSHTVVELMRQGRTAIEACQEATRRIARKHRSLDGMQVGFLAIRADGDHGGWSLRPGFSIALRAAEGGDLYTAGSELP